MKFFTLAALALFSLNSHAQSFLVMDNGIVITTDTNGFAYDFGHYAYPQKISLKGGQYFVEEGNILATVDENGLLFRKYELIPEKIIGKGINYFIAPDGSVYTIDRKGYVKVSQDEAYQNAVTFGGNYFIAATDPDKKDLALFVVTADGAIVKPEVPRLKVSEIISYGGSYFMTNRGIVFTVAKDGTVTPKDDMRVGILQKKGGSYFVDSSNLFYTVSESGELQMPSLPIGLRVPTILRLGSNYFIDQQGRFYLVDKAGKVWEKTVRDQDFRLAKVISL